MPRVASAGRRRAHLACSPDPQRRAPGLQDLALVLASAGTELERPEAKFPTAALATLTLPRTTWRRLSQADAVLVAYVVPKQLG